MERLAFIVSLTLFVVLNSCIFGTHANESSPIYYQHSNGKISTKKEESNYDNSNNNNNNSNNKIVTVHDIEILRASERLALIEIYTETQGEKWRDNAKWLNGDPCVNNWYGVTCNAMNLVTAIQLAANQVNGTIPDIFQQFTQLTVLDLSLNYLKGAAPPSITSLVLLEEVDLGYNYLLMSMSLFSGMKQLEKLCLRWNTLITGSLHAIKNLKKLHTLSLRDNHMESLTLEGIEQLTSLKYVDLTKSGLRGELKPKYLHNLVTFHASNNRLSGSLFSQMGTEERNDEYSLDALKELDVAFNTLSGPIPRMIQAKNLEKLDLSNNRFYKCNFVLSDHEKLTSLKMNSNRLEQPFFYNFYMMKNIEEFECSHCHLNGVISMPKDHVFKYLKFFNVYNNQLTGQLPSALWNMKALEVLDVSNNQLSGEISSKIGQLTALSTVRLHFNQFSGSIPIEFSMLVGLETLRLEHNKFTGALENIFENMKHLSLVSIHDNEITSIPTKLPKHVQVWPYHLRPSSSSSKNGFQETTLVVYHNQLTVEETNQTKVEDVRMFRVCGTMNDFYANVLFEAGWLKTNTERWHATYGICWEEERDRDPRNVLSIQRVSRFPDVRQVSDKGLLTHNIDAMRALFPDDYSFYPTSFTIPNQLDEYIAEFDRVQLTLRDASNTNVDSSGNLWLMKPRARCCGEGIRIINNASQSTEIVDPNLGEWYVQKFVSPPALIDGHKFVFRLFALVTSFSPLRVQLYHDGLIFYTFTEYTVENQTAKRSYISDYFFTEKQSDYYVLVQDYLTNMASNTHFKTASKSGNGSSNEYIPKSQEGGPINAKKVWDDIKSVVVKSLISTLKWTTPMEATKTTFGTTYEIFGYDIVLDDDLNPFLCEINETPNMGLEVNYHEDYNGLGEMIEKVDFDYKTSLMKATLAVADVEPRWDLNELSDMQDEVLHLIKKESLSCVVMHSRTIIEKDDSGSSSSTVDCLHENDLKMIVKLESELRRSDDNEYDQIFPCVECFKYFKFLSVHGLEWNDVLNVWWLRQRETMRYYNGLTHRYEKDYIEKHGEPKYETWLSFLNNVEKEES